MGFGAGLFEGLDKAMVFGLVQGEFGGFEGGFFLAFEFAGDQIGQVGEAEFFVERDEIGFDVAGAHKVDAGEQDAVGIEQGLHPGRGFLLEEAPLGGGEAEVVVVMEAGEAGFGDFAKFGVFGGGVDDEGRVELLLDVAIRLEKEGEEFGDVVGDEVEFDGAAEGFEGEGVFDGVEAEEFAGREDVGSAEIEIGIGGWETVEVGAADGGEEEGVGVCGGFGLEE